MASTKLTALVMHSSAYEHTAAHNVSIKPVRQSTSDKIRARATKLHNFFSKHFKPTLPSPSIQAAYDEVMAQGHKSTMARDRAARDAVELAVAVEKLERTEREHQRKDEEEWAKTARKAEKKGRPAPKPLSESCDPQLERVKNCGRPTNYEWNPPETVTLRPRTIRFDTMPTAVKGKLGQPSTRRQAPQRRRQLAPVAESDSETAAESKRDSWGSSTTAVESDDQERINRFKRDPKKRLVELSIPADIEKLVQHRQLGTRQPSSTLEGAAQVVRFATGVKKVIRCKSPQQQRRLPVQPSPRRQSAPQQRQPGVRFDTSAVKVTESLGTKALKVGDEWTRKDRAVWWKEPFEQERAYPICAF